MYFADAGQHLEHRLFVDHAMPNCRSRVDYKGALQGQDAHAVWIGDVIIRAEATGTDTYERNRNLVLTDGTRVELRAEPGDPHRRGGRGRARERQRPAGGPAPVLPDGPGHPGGRGAAAGDPRVLRHADRPDRDPARWPSASPPGSSWSWHDRVAAGGTSEVHAAPARWPTCPTTGPSGSRWTASRSRSSGPRARCTRCATSARTRRSRCPRARSTTTRWSAGCTGPASTCAPASPPGRRPPSRWPPIQVKIEGDDVYVSLT